MSRVKVSKTDKIAWSSWEKRNLLSWLHRHRGMSWKEKARAYFRLFRVKRSGEALRCKQNYLLRNRRFMQESLSGTRARREEARAAYLPSLPIFTPRGSRTRTRDLIGALEQLAVSERRRLTNDWNKIERLPGSTMRLPQTPISKPSRHASYLQKFVHRMAAATRTPRNVALL
ncbi:hypothetical protein PENANT_c138G11122 [Penicillium antarcticum]|uniref:Uncharacterized protein n=1 Tax=Penicillium antarcticum TaxID=416450 RepID=A0A1V6PGX8_9EURO|nr:hypothetical protein PENANT_c138G11122 [Penicillium antarcticum]